MTAVSQLASQNGGTFVCRLGLHEVAKLVIGIPMLTSSRSVHFWLSLCNAAHFKGAEELVRGFQRADELGPAAQKAHCLQFTSDLINKVRRNRNGHTVPVGAASCGISA